MAVHGRKLKNGWMTFSFGDWTEKDGRAYRLTGDYFPPVPGRAEGLLRLAVTEWLFDPDHPGDFYLAELAFRPCMLWEIKLPNPPDCDGLCAMVEAEFRKKGFEV